MSAATVERPVEPAAALRALDAAVDALLAADYTGLSDEQLVELLRGKERLRRRLEAAEHAPILEVAARQLPAQHSVRTTAGFLRWLLRLDPREAAGRVRAAEAAGVRRALTGQTLPPAYPVVAAAQVAGQISARHAAIVVSTIEKLPDPARSEHAVEVEETLVGYATKFDPDCLGRQARKLGECYDPDGPAPDDEHRQRTRELTITQRPDGSSFGRFEATAELTALLLTHLDALAAPKPEKDGVKDPRTAPQRRHDASLKGSSSCCGPSCCPRSRASPPPS